MSRLFWLCLAILPLGLLGGLCLLRGAAPQPHCSPVDLALLPGGKLAITANHTADSVSLVDLEAGKVLAETGVGKKPIAVAVSADGKRAAVSNQWSGSVTLIEVQERGLKALGDVKVGYQPFGLAFAADGQSLFVAVGGADEVLELDWASRKVRRRFEAPREPRQVALSPDGKWLAATSNRSGAFRCWSLETGKLHWERRHEEGFNFRGLVFEPGGKHLLLTHLHRRESAVAKQQIEEGWVIDSRLSRLSLSTEEYGHWQIGLDTRGQAVGDPHGVACSPDGSTILLTASGTHELLVLPGGHIPWAPGEPGDFLDVGLEIGKHKMRRIELGGRPMGVAFRTAGTSPAARNEAVVANYLLDSIQVVDLQAEKVARTIHLGGPAEPSLARRGEALFYDAGRSTAQWFSCHTCHSDGHTCHMLFDTLNDNSYGNRKLTPSLRNVAKTAPYTWHGWQKELTDAVEKSFVETMFGPKPSADEVKAVVAFLATLEDPPNPHRNPDGSFSESAQRGQALFNEKARCVRCHKGDLYFSESNYDLKQEHDGSPYDFWNPPTLRGLIDRGPYLHNGRAKTLDDLLKEAHSSEKLGGQPLTPVERKDLAEFLKGL